VGVTGSVLPAALDLINESILVVLSTLLSLGALRTEVILKALSVPFGIWPVLLDEILKILAIRLSWIRNAVVRQPALKLGFVPFVVSYEYRLALHSFKGGQYIYKSRCATRTYELW
jgi:hypothetical protein